MEKCSDFDFEKEYEKLKKKYKLPDLKKLLENFDVEKLFERETVFLLREIRRTISDKFYAYLNFFEMIINPNSSPLFVFSVLRRANGEIGSRPKEIYKELSKLQMKSLKLDTIYNEKEEANFIKDSFKKWESLKKDIYSLVERFEECLDKESGSKKGSYVG